MKREAEYNSTIIEQELDKLEHDYYDTTLTLMHVNYRFHEFWKKAKEVTALFKSTKNLVQKDRERLWDRYSTICTSVKSIQRERDNESANNKDTIFSLLNDVYFQAGGSSNLEELIKAKSSQSYILGLMKEKTLIKKDRDSCWEFWKRIGEVIYSKQGEIGEKNFFRIREKARDALNKSNYGDPYETFKEIKAVQNSIKESYMTRGQRSELRETLNYAWENASSRISEKKAERRRKYDDWYERMEGHIQRWENNIGKSEEYISSLEEQINRLEDEAANARTDNYNDRVTGWIEEKYEKIIEVKGQIRELEDKISSVKNKLK